jgi:hypothetical protein
MKITNKYGDYLINEFKKLDTKINKKLKPIKKKINKTLNLINLMIKALLKTIYGIIGIKLTPKDKTPITSFKVIGTIGIPIILILAVGYGITQLHKTTDVTQYYAPSIIAEVTPMPIDYSKISEPKLILQDEHTTIKSYKLASQTFYPGSTIKNNITITPIPTPYVTKIPTPTPNIKPNNQIGFNNFNFVNVDGLNTNYKLPKSQASYKIGEKVNLNMELTNLKKEKLDNIKATLSINSYYINKADNQPSINPLFVQEIFNQDGLDLEEYESFNLNRNIEINSIIPKGDYLLIINFVGDNNAKLKIQEIITIK